MCHHFSARSTRQHRARSATELKMLLKISTTSKFSNTISSPPDKLILEEPDVLFERPIYFKVFHSWEDDPLHSSTLSL